VAAGEIATAMVISGADAQLLDLYQHYCDEWARFPAALSSPLLPRTA
jgi:hypothetical protein